MAIINKDILLQSCIWDIYVYFVIFDEKKNDQTAKQPTILRNNQLSCETTNYLAKQPTILQNNQLSCETTNYPAKQPTIQPNKRI
jgi:hypothetical protein